MLLWLAQFFQQDAGWLRIVSYISFRAVAATLTALAIGLAAGPSVIRLLTRLKVGQAVRTDGPQTHLVKSGTPTMGGLLILIAIAIATLLWCDLSNRFVWIVMVVTMGFGVIGWVDDYRKVVYKNPNGMSSREKYFWQSMIGMSAAVYLAFAVSGQSNYEVWHLFIEWVSSGFSMDLPPKADFIIPFFKTISYPLGVWGFIALTYFVIVGTSNAVNLTDGLDGLTIMPTIMVGTALGVFAYLTGRCRVFALFVHPLYSRNGGIAGFLRRDGRSGTGVFVVQRLSGTNVHGGCRCACAGRGAGNHCRDRAAGNRFVRDGRHFRWPKPSRSCCRLRISNIPRRNTGSAGVFS